LKDNTASVLCQVPVEVASFLLNEKRTEIAKIELKQRINVLMVPNKSLETPNYKLERLKHDDPRLDNITASYKMAEEVEDVVAVTRRSQEPTNRQTPIIKGVLPDAPAPVAPPKADPAPLAAEPASAPPPAVAETGFFGWIKGLFGSPPAPTVTPAPAVNPASAKEDKRDRPDGRGGRDGARRGEPRSDGRGDRGPRGDGRPPRGEGRSGNRGGNRGERTERGPRERSDAQANPALDANVGAPMDAGAGNPVDANRNESRAERPNRNGERGNRPDRGERRPSRNQAPGNASGLAQETGEPAPLMDDSAPMGSDPTTGNPQDDGASREKRSRDRYGRERKPRGERTESAAPQADAEIDVPAQDEAAPRKSYFAQTSGAADVGSPESALADTRDAPPSQASAAPAEDRQPVNAIATSASPNAETTQATSAAERLAIAPAPVAAAPATSMPAALVAPALGMPSVVSYALPVDQLAGIAQQSGLTWVNSNAEKIAAVQAVIASEPKPMHVPRERPPVVALDDRPLVLVETRLDLRDISLPFEETQPG
jgi:ribonuclease E